KRHKGYWISLIPAVFMTCVSVSYICIAPEGFQLPQHLSYLISAIACVVIIFLFYRFIYLNKGKLLAENQLFNKK
ncbi:MAG TPA: carbon starvation protein A, partial [Paludibacteraceae bacterium]|nr:carbon starvation protein A [Paludibacteraceae bacterium]